MIFLLFFLALPIAAFSGEIKLLILEKEKALEKAKTATQKSVLYYELAQSYWKDQDHEKAFRHFLLALKNSEKSQTYEMCEAEKNLYDEALQYYLQEGAIDPLKTAETIISRYGPLADKNKDYLFLNMLVASSYANLGDFEKFFTFFYENYSKLTASFLADKAIAMLNLRLYAIAIVPDEKKHFEKASIQHLKSALEKNGTDSSIYKFLMLFSSDEPKLFYLEKLCENKVKLPRGEILFYINEAKKLSQKELGLKIIEIQSSHYQYSRSIEEAKIYLEKG